MNYSRDIQQLEQYYFFSDQIVGQLKFHNEFFFDKCRRPIVISAFHMFKVYDAHDDEDINYEFMGMKQNVRVVFISKRSFCIRLYDEVCKTDKLITLDVIRLIGFTTSTATAI